jgi:hypothetical protein
MKQQVIAYYRLVRHDRRLLLLRGWNFLFLSWSLFFIKNLADRGPWTPHGPIWSGPPTANLYLPKDFSQTTTNPTACSFGWWLMAGADLFWEKSTAGLLLVASFIWEKSTTGWWLISQANRPVIRDYCSIYYLRKNMANLFIFTCVHADPQQDYKNGQTCFVLSTRVHCG